MNRQLDGAACRNIPAEQVDRIFFATTSGPRHPKLLNEAREICRACPCRRDCLTLAQSMHPIPDGIWGGLTEIERARLNARTRHLNGGNAV